jgi:hypothetical protein
MNHENPTNSPSPLETVSQSEKTDFLEGGEAVRWKRFRAVTFSRSDSAVPSV